MIYFIIFFILLVCAIKFDFLNDKAGKNFMYIFLCVVLIIFSGIRYRVGGDTLNYMFAFDLIPNIYESNFFEKVKDQRAEIGWLVINGIIKIFSDDFYLVQFVQAFIVNIAMFVFIKKYTNKIFLGVLFYYVIFYLYLNFEILRESIAISIFIIWGLKFLFEKKYILYYLSCIIALFFHTSAVILILIPFIYQITYKYKFNYYIYFSILYLIGVILSSFFYSFIANSALFSIFSSKFDTYLDYNFTINGIIMAYFMYVLLPLYVYKKSEKTNNQLKQLLLVYSFIGALSGLFPIFFRFVNYFTPILIVSLCYITFKILTTKNSPRLENALMFVFFTVIFFNIKIIQTIDVNRNIKWYSRWYPYHSIFNQQEDPDREYIWQQQFK